MKWDPTSYSVYRGEYFSLWVWHVQRSCGRRSCEKSPEAIMQRSKGVWFRVDPEKPDSYLFGGGLQR